jgi:hypothetical protein
MTDPFEIYRLRKQNEKLLRRVNELEAELKADQAAMINQLKELNRLRYELAKHEGREMMRGGREEMLREVAK